MGEERTYNDRRSQVQKQFGARLRAAREDRNMSQRQLALELDLFLEDIVGFENGETAAPVTLLPEISRLFGKPIDHWLDEEA